jgi:hypothetical protein
MNQFLKSPKSRTFCSAFLSLCLGISAFACGAKRDSSDGSQPPGRQSQDGRPRSEGVPIDRGLNCLTAGDPVEEPSSVGVDTKPPELEAVVLNKDVYAPGDTLEILFKARDDFSGVSHITTPVSSGGVAIGDAAGKVSPLGVRSSGSNRRMPDGSFCYVIGKVSGFVPTGRYLLRFFYLYDHAGNSVRYELDQSQEKYLRVERGDETKATTDIPAATFELRYDDI